MRRTNCCHTFLAFVLKFLNFLQTFIGVSIIVYSCYMLNQWYRHGDGGDVAPSPASSPVNFLHTPFAISDSISAFDDVTPLNLAAEVVLSDGLKLNSHSLPAPWFIYAFMGVGVLLCCITCIGHIAAEAINGCCLCFYAVLATVIILLEVALVAFIALDHSWEKDLPFDPTGELHDLRAFIEENADVCKWVGMAIIVIQALSLLFAFTLRALVSSPRSDSDIEGDYDVRDRPWEPLLNPRSSPMSGSTVGDARGSHSDIWSSRMREKYGSKIDNARSNMNAPVDGNSKQLGQGSSSN